MVEKRRPARNGAADQTASLGSGGRGKLEAAIATYVERRNSGEEIDPIEVLESHPDLAPEILRALETFDTLEPSRMPRTPELVGTIGDFTLRRQVGRGGMGVVYDAWQTSMDRRVALKVLPPGVAADDKTFQRFMREARAAGKLNHPNVVPVHAMGQDGNTPYYAMEFIEGESLAQLLERIKGAPLGSPTPFGPKGDVRYFANIAEAFAGVAEGLQHAHSLGVVHRDVKPSNLMLDLRASGSAPLLRVLDFGLARLEGQASLTMTGDFLGTVLYMSPEQAMAKRIALDHRTDIYSLGATLYETLAGRPPFEGKDYHDTLSQIIFREPAPLRGVAPADLETIALKCLRKEPLDRYGTAEALAQDLRRFVRQDPIEARPQTLWEKLRHRLYVHRVRLGLAAALVLLVAATALLARGYLAERLRERNGLYGRSIDEAVMELEYGRVAVPSLASKSLVLMRPEAFLRPQAGELAGLSGVSGVEQALHQLETAIALFPGRVDARYHRCRALKTLGRHQDALAEVEEILRLQPRFTPASVFRNELCRQLGLDVVGVVAEPERPGQSPTWEAIWLRAHDAIAAGNWEEADGAYSELIALQGTTDEPYLGSAIEIRLGRGIARLCRRSTLGAAEDFAVARVQWPKAIAPALFLGRTYCQIDDAEHRQRADQIFDDVFSAAPPDSRDALALEIAFTLSLAERKERSLEWLDRVGDRLALPREWGRVFFRYFLHFNKGSMPLEEAILAAESAATRYPSDPILTALLSLVDSSVPERRHRAQEGIESAIELTATRRETEFSVAFLAAWVYGNLGSYQKSEPMYAKSESMYRKAIQLDPHFGATYGNQAASYFEQGKFEDAVRECRRALDVDRSSDWVRLTLASALRRLGKPGEARQVLEETKLSGHWSAQKHRLLGEIDEEEGRLEDALVEYQAALGVRPESKSTQARLRAVLEALGK